MRGQYITGAQACQCRNLDSQLFSLLVSVSYADSLPAAAYIISALPQRFSSCAGSVATEVELPVRLQSFYRFAHSVELDGRPWSLDSITPSEVRKAAIAVHWFHRVSIERARICPPSSGPLDHLDATQIIGGRLQLEVRFLGGRRSVSSGLPSQHRCTHGDKSERPGRCNLLVLCTQLVLVFRLRALSASTADSPSALSSADGWIAA
jgi:hypothetical protein